VFNKAQVVDLLISHNQIQVRARPYDEKSSQWGDENVKQGAVLHEDYVIFDPLPDDAFGANVHLILSDSFSLDVSSQRCIVVSFCIENTKELELASAAEKISIDLGLEAGKYALYYEVCEGGEIFYKLTFVPVETKVDARYLLDDPWGGVKGNLLVLGVA
jgi:hypothetical protein